MSQKLFFFLSLILLFNARIHAQEGIVLQTDYLADNMMLIHPGMTGANLIGSRLIMGVRKQWFKIEDAPQTNLLTFETSLFPTATFGLIAYNDSNGSFQRNSLLFSYAYKINLTEEVWNTRRPFPTKNDSAQQLIFGLTFGNFNTSIDQSGFNENIFDPAIGDNISPGSYQNINVGVAYNATKISLQLSAKNFPLSNDLDNRIVSPIVLEKKNFKQYLLGGQFRFFAFEDVTFEPSFLVQYFTNTKNQLYDFSFKTSKLFRGGRLWAGLSYRNNFEQLNELETVPLNPSFYDRLSALIGMNYKNFMLSYQYSNVLGKNALTAQGYHFLVLGFQF